MLLMMTTIKYLKALNSHIINLIFPNHIIDIITSNKITIKLAISQ